MKIIFVVDQMREGGAERVIAGLSNEMTIYKHELYIVMLNENEARSHYIVNENVKLIPIKSVYNKNNPIKKVLLLKKCIIEIRPDIVISFLHHINIYTDLAITGLKIPHIVSERNDPKRRPEGRFMRILRNYVFWKSDGCVFQTNNAKHFFSKSIQIKSTIIPNPIILMHSPNTTNKREKMITAVGRLVPQKNYNMMLNAFSLFSERNQGYKLIICGEGYYRSNIEKLIMDLNLCDNVSLVGQVANPHEIIYSSAVFALSSDYEGMPNALMEAMALGVPSVSTDCPSGGPSELIINNENGILVPVGNEQAMADAFDKIVNHPEFADKISKKAKELYEFYSVKKITQKWLNYIMKIINQRK